MHYRSEEPACCQQDGLIAAAHTVEFEALD
jgi:hypothetical protein